MRWRITGTWTNVDAAAHRAILVVRGFDHRGAALPTDTTHRVPAQLWLEVKTTDPRGYEGLGALESIALDHTFEMDEVASVEETPNAYGMLLDFRIELAEEA